MGNQKSNLQPSWISHVIGANSAMLRMRGTRWRQPAQTTAPSVAPCYNDAVAMEDKPSPCTLRICDRPLLQPVPRTLRICDRTIALYLVPWDSAQANLHPLPCTLRMTPWGSQGILHPVPCTLRLSPKSSQGTLYPIPWECFPEAPRARRQRQYAQGRRCQWHPEGVGRGMLHATKFWKKMTLGSGGGMRGQLLLRRPKKWKM